MLLFLVVFGTLNAAKGNELYVGKAVADISPKLPVALMGQFHLRIAETADTQLLANILVLETRREGQPIEQLVFVACDLIYISDNLRRELLDAVSRLMPGFNVNNIVLSATHTHTAPVLEDDPGESSFLYPIPEEGVVPVKEYRQLFVDAVSKAIKQAWDSRVRGSFTFGVSRASVGYNRRVHYQDGSTAMYGNANRPDFQEIEGYEDQDVQSLFFWNLDEELLAVAVNIACPAQVFEHLERVNADYWHPVRNTLREEYGDDLTVLGWISAAGDVSPHNIFTKAAEARMAQLSGLSRADDIAQRIVGAVKETYKTVQQDKRKDVVISHQYELLELPVRRVTEEEYRQARTAYEELSDQIKKDAEKIKNLYAPMTWNGDVLKRYESQSDNSQFYSSGIHVVRIGDVAICTNQFEMFTDYGIRIKARSAAVQTFVIQLAGPGTYLPTAKAIAGGGYSAVVQSSVVGAEGGQVLVDRTLEIIGELWKE